MIPRGKIVYLGGFDDKNMKKTAKTRLFCQ